jgi:hypothetical protein
LVNLKEWKKKWENYFKIELLWGKKDGQPEGD